MALNVEPGSNVIVYERPWNKPFPSIDHDIRPFWDGLREHKFLLFRCKSCGAWYWPAAFCTQHDNDPRMSNLAWEEASGRGTVFALSVVYIAFHPGFVEDLPYANLLIELEEGPMISSNLVQYDPEQAVVGMPVEVVFEDHPLEGFTLPKFRPRTA